MANMIKIGLYLFIFFLPWQTRLIWQDAFINGSVWEYGRLSLYGTEILLWLVLGFFGFWLWRHKKNHRLSMAEMIRQSRQPAAAVYWLMVIFIFVAAISILFAPSRQLAYYAWLHLAASAALVALVVNIKPDFSKVAFSFCLSAALQGLFGIGQFFTQSVFANKWLGLALHLPNSAGAVVLETASERWLRAYGSFPHPNILGGYLVLGLIFLFYFAWRLDQPKARWAVLAGILIMAAGLFFTFSRSAWLALILVLALLGFWLIYIKDKNGVWQWRKILLVLLVLFSALSAIYWPLLAARLMGEGRLEAVSISQRLSFTTQALQLIGAHWLGGTGIGNYTLAVFQNISRVWPGHYYQPVHNIYLLIFAELGIFGALVFGAMVFLLLFSLTKRIFLTRAAPAGISEPGGADTSALPLEQEAAMALLCLIAILFIGLFDHYFWTLFSGIMVFWLIFALNLRNLKGNSR